MERMEWVFVRFSLYLRMSRFDDISRSAPFGMPYTDENGADRYKFGGKEYDAVGSLNLYDFEARMYDPALARFMSPDPLADRYPSVSPYAYCANNPVRYIDPSGMKIEINGSEFSSQLNQNNLDEMTKHLAIGLNIVNDNGGSQIISGMINDSRIYSFNTNSGSVESYTQLASNGVDVNVQIGAANFSDGTKDRVYAAIAHESMHCAQYMNNQGGASIWNEVEAYVFEQVIGYNSLENNFPDGKYFKGMLIQSDNNSLKFSQSMKILISGYNSNAMNSAVANFKSQSSYNNNQLYNRYKLYNSTRNNSLLKKYSIKANIDL